MYSLSTACNKLHQAKNKTFMLNAIAWITKFDINNLSSYILSNVYNSLIFYLY